MKAHNKNSIMCLKLLYFLIENNALLVVVC